MVMVFINGQMAGSTKVTGRTTRWRAEVYLHGLTTGDTKENISMIKRKAKVFSTGLMGDNMRENGRMASNMELEYTHQQVVKLGKDSGLMAKEWLGSDISTKLTQFS